MKLCYSYFVFGIRKNNATLEVKSVSLNVCAHTVPHTHNGPQQAFRLGVKTEEEGVIASRQEIFRVSMT